MPRIIIIDDAPTDMLAALQRLSEAGSDRSVTGAQLTLRARGLAPRECTIVQLDMAGYTRAEIAAQLHLSVHTVKSYWKDIYAKLGVHSRGDLRRLLSDRDEEGICVGEGLGVRS